MKPQITERTNKAWKAIQLVGAAIVAVGVWIGYPAVQAGTLTPHHPAMYTCYAGLGVAVVGSILAWWFHG